MTCRTELASVRKPVRYEITSDSMPIFKNIGAIAYSHDLFWCSLVFLLNNDLDACRHTGKASLWPGLPKPWLLKKRISNPDFGQKGPFSSKTDQNRPNSTVLSALDPDSGTWTRLGPDPGGLPTRPGPRIRAQTRPRLGPGPRSGSKMGSWARPGDPSGAPPGPGCPYRPLISYKIGGIPTKTLEG